MQKSILILFLIISFAFAEVKKELTVACSRSWIPYSYADENGEPKGMLVDFWRAFGEEQNVKINFLLTTWSDTLENIKNSKADIHSGLFKSKERATYMDFAKELPIILSENLFVSKDIDVENLDELENNYLGAVKNGYESAFISEHYPKIKLAFYASSQEMIEEATYGQVDAFVSDYAVGVYYLNKYNGKEDFKSVSTFFTKHLYIGVKKGDRELARFISKGVSKMSKDDINRIISKWALQVGVLPDGFMTAIFGGFISLFIIFLILYVAILKKQVKERTKKLLKLSQTDNLTKCHNRQKIDEIFLSEINRFNRYDTIFSVIMLDIDKFKDVNDTYGHQSGDSVLVELTALIKNQIRESDSLGRWGGEEFLIICAQTNIDEAMKLAEKLRKKIENFEFNVVGTCTASFGVSQIHKDDEIKDIFQRIDEALYISKENGRNQINSL